MRVGMKWERVEVVAASGTEFGVVSDVNGCLTLVVKRPGEEWPHGITPQSGQNAIAEGFTRYIVEAD